MTTAAYAIGDFRDVEEEVARLARQARFMGELEREAFAAVGFPTEGDVLDVGCGPGLAAEAMGEAWPGVSLNGVDLDADALSRARTRLPVLRAAAERLPWPSARFSAAYTRFVLRHVGRPERVLAEMKRVVRPGGTVVAADADDGTLVMHPLPDGFERVLRARHESFRRRGADPFIGRRLFELAGAAGLEDLRAHPVTVDSTQVGAEAFAHVVVSPIADAIDPDLMSPREVEEVARGIADWGRSRSSFGLATLMVVGGRRGRD